MVADGSPAAALQESPGRPFRSVAARRERRNPRFLETHSHGLRHHAGDQPVAIRCKMEDVEGPPSIAIYASDGKRIPAPVPSAQAETLPTLPALSAGGFYSLVINPAARHYSLTFTQAGGAPFEASRHSPLTLDERGLRPALLLRAQGVQELPNLSEHASVLTANLAPVRLVVKDNAGQTLLDQSGPIDGGSTWEKGDMKDKVFAIQVPNGQAGRIWSLSLLDAKHETAGKKKGFVQFRLRGLPPVVASAPAQLLIDKQDE